MELLDLIIKLLQDVATSATVLAAVLRAIYIYLSD